LTLSSDFPLQCRRCKGRCCSEGYFDFLQVLPEDITRLAKHLQITSRQLKSKYLVHQDGLWALFLGRGCPFFDHYKHACKVHIARPRGCREFEVGSEKCQQAQEAPSFILNQLHRMMRGY